MSDEVKGKVFRNNAPLTSRVKKMMQSDEDVGKVAKATPVLIGACTTGWLEAGPVSSDSLLTTPPALAAPLQPRRWTSSCTRSQRELSRWRRAAAHVSSPPPTCE